MKKLHDAFRGQECRMGKIRLIVFLMLISLGEAYACSCDFLYETPEAVAEVVDSVDIVFTGTAVATSTTDGGRRQLSHLTVWEIWKGPNKEIVKMLTLPTPTCGMWFEEGGQYLVFASDDNEDGFYSASWCKLTWEVNHPIAQDTIKILNEMHPVNN